MEVNALTHTCTHVHNDHAYVEKLFCVYEYTCTEAPPNTRVYAHTQASVHALYFCVPRLMILTNNIVNSNHDANPNPSNTNPDAHSS